MTDDRYSGGPKGAQRAGMSLEELRSTLRRAGLSGLRAGAADTVPTAAMGKIYKYAAEIGAISDCPPKTLSPAVGVAFRWVHNPFITSDFEPPATRSAKRRGRCSAWGLSMFASRAAAVKRHRELEQGPLPNVRKLFGDHVAVGTLDPSMGDTTTPNSEGHFDLFEHAGGDVESAFQLDGAI